MGNSLKAMKTLLREQGLPAFAAEQIYQWAFKRGIRDEGRWSNVSGKVKRYIVANFDLSLPHIAHHQLSCDGTHKFLMAMHDGHTVETVAIAAQTSARKRLTLCLSTQVGCALGCTFCHTGTMGLTRHLSAGEIVGQFLAAKYWLEQNRHCESPTNIVYMGQGEPLHNFEEVKRATQVFMEDQGLSISQRKITLSTSGLVPQIEKLGDFPPVNIAISLHAANNPLRSKLMPINKTYGLERLFHAIETIPLKARRRISYEYLLIEGINDQLRDIEDLDRLINPKKSKINLIPFNPYPNSYFKAPKQQKMLWFHNELCRRGHVCTIRTTKGSDILAACGQLKSSPEAASRCI